MRLSRFVVPYRDVRQGEHVLYDVLADRYVGVDDPTLEAITRWGAGGKARGRDEREARQVLHEDGFLVEDRAEDDARLRASYAEARKGVPGTLFVTLMPTLACNLACTYCFQKDSPAFNKMPQATEDATLEWILRTVDARKLDTLKVHYFGGEPTTRKEFCLRTAEIFDAAMRARGGIFQWEMTTNGIELDLEFALAMKKFGDGGAFKVTLDGDKETHDTMRVYRDGRGSFDAIFENVKALAPHMRVRIGGNFLPGQVASFEKLIARLEESGVAKDLEGVRFKPIIDVDQAKKSGGSCTGCSSGKDETQEARDLVQLGGAVGKRKIAAARAHAEPLETLLGPCELHWENNYTIDPDGYIYKCPAVAGRTEMAVASVGSPDPETEAPLLKLRPWEQCGDCAYLPVCMGGCLGGKFLQTGHARDVACKKEIFERSFAEAIPRRYLAEFSQAPDVNQAA